MKLYILKNYTQKERAEDSNYSENIRLVAEVPPTGDLEYQTIVRGRLRVQG